MATYSSSFTNPYPNGWKNTPEQTTPITAEALQAHTDALQAIDDYLVANPIPESGSGGGGTTNYEQLSNKPSINGVELVGNKSLEDLGITGGGETGTTDYNNLENKPSINGTELKGDVTLDIPTKTSDLTNDSGFLTDIKGESYNDLSDKPQINGIDLQGNLTVEELGLLDITESPDTTLENSKDGILKIKDIYGNTTQDGEPTPDVPIEIESVVISEIRTCGKNLLKTTARTVTNNGITFTINEDGTVVTDGTSTARVTLILFKDVLKAGSYVLSQGRITRGDSVSIHALYNKEDGSAVYVDLFNDTDGFAKFTLAQDTEVSIKADVRNAGMTINNVTLYPMLEVGTVKTDWEPYTESIATLSGPITLNGVGGVQDYVDAKRWVLVQNCYVKEFIGKETLTGWANTTGGGILFGYTDSHIANNQGNGLTGSFCNYLTETTSGQSWNSTDLGFSIHQSGTPLRFRLPEGITTLEEAQAWMAEKYASGNPFTVIVARKDIIETPLPEADVEALKSLKTYDGVTHIFTDSEVEPDWFVEYNTTRVGTELDEIDSELAKINKRITDIGTTAQINYSTEEQVVGTWIDGKPLYQKTIIGNFEGKNIGTSAIGDLDLSSLNIEYLRPIDICLYSDLLKQYTPPVFWLSNTNLSYYWYSDDSKTMGMFIGSALGTGKYEITIQYTKTTDTV